MVLPLPNLPSQGPSAPLGLCPEPVCSRLGRETQGGFEPGDCPLRFPPGLRLVSPPSSLSSLLSPLTLTPDVGQCVEGAVGWLCPSSRFGGLL